MNVDERNSYYLSGPIDRDDIWPKVKEYEDQRFQFRWDFGLNELPPNPGLITIRGARQVGKSTWLELQLLNTLEEFGLGTAFFLSGDYIFSIDDFEKKLLELEASFSKKSKVRRIFIDEITQIKGWEKVLKRLIDSGHLLNILIVTTGSNASDLRRGSERLPGRKGNLQRTEYIFLPISFKEFYYQVKNEIGTFESDTLWAYILSGGSPQAIKSLYYSDKLDDTFVTLISDWILGDLASSGRSRILFSNLLKKLYQIAPSPISYTKLAQDAGLANNTAALDYVEKLADLLCIEPMLAWDKDKKVGLSKKQSKFPFINLAMAWTFHPKLPRYIHELKDMKGQERGALYEWVVAQEIWRRQLLEAQSTSVRNYNDLFYWSSKEHEIDFITSNEKFYEVKAGTTTPKEFYWFSEIFPKKHLTVISDSEYETSFIHSMKLENFLLEAPSELYYDSDKIPWENTEL